VASPPAGSLLCHTLSLLLPLPRLSYTVLAREEKRKKEKKNAETEEEKEGKEEKIRKKKNNMGLLSLMPSVCVIKGKKKKKKKPSMLKSFQKNTSWLAIFRNELSNLFFY